MSDHREPDNLHQSRLVADQPEAGGDRGTLPRPTRIHPGRPSKDVAIKAVSDLLSRKKPAIDQVPTLGRAQLPSFPRSREATISQLKKSPSLRAKLDSPRTSMEPPPVELPEGGSTAKTIGGQPPSGEIPRAGSPEPSGGSDQLQTASVPSKSVGRGLEATGPRPEKRRPESGLGSSSTLIREGQGTPGPSVGPGEVISPDAGKFDGRISHRDPGPIGGTEHPGDLPVSPGTVRAASIGLPRAARPAAGSEPPLGIGAEAIQPGVSASRSVLEAGARTIPSTRADASPIAVRNPLVSGMRHLQVAPQDFPGTGGMGAGLDATGAGVWSAQPSFGGSAMPQGGGTIDLSKTNELLRQLVDAVKKQRDGSLPVGGQSAYPGR